MSTSIVSPDTPLEKLSNDELLAEFQEEKSYKKANLYALVARRANCDFRVKQLLLSLVLDYRLREELFLNTIIHAWVPILFMMEESAPHVKSEILGSIANEWTIREKQEFLDYIKLSPEYFQFFKHLKESI